MFTPDDLRTLSALAIETWESGIDRDWSVPAGTLEWSCFRTAAHAVDTTFAPALFLASRNQHAYPNFEDLRPLPGATVADLVDGLRAMTNILWAVVVTTDPDVRAIIRRRPDVELAAPADFAPRGALELILHTYDIACGLDIAFDPPRDLCERLLVHARNWPHAEYEPTGDAWSNLRAAYGRPTW